MNYGILLQKRNYYGVQSEMLNWFTTYLENRKQRVEFKSQFACKLKFEIVKCGILQGSVLGPLMFDIYTNDFPLNI